MTDWHLPRSSSVLHWPSIPRSASLHPSAFPAARHALEPADCRAAHSNAVAEKRVKGEASRTDSRLLEAVREALEPHDSGSVAIEFRSASVEDMEPVRDSEAVRKTASAASELGSCVVLDKEEARRSQGAASVVHDAGHDGRTRSNDNAVGAVARMVVGLGQPYAVEASGSLHLLVASSHQAVEAEEEAELATTPHGWDEW